MSYYIAVLKNYVGFSGRARRAEYWFFTLFNIIITLVLAGLMAAVPALAILYFLYILATLLPSLAVLFRRLHDTDRSAWWVLIGLIPLVGSIILLVFLVQDSTPGANRFGPNPKEIAA